MTRPRFMSPRGAEGRLFRNDGPINPVADYDSAWAMALSERKVINAHKNALNIVAEVEKRFHGSVSVQAGAGVRRRVEVPLQEQLDSASERTRSNIAGQSLQKAQLLFNLVEMTPINAEMESISMPSIPALDQQ